MKKIIFPVILMLFSFSGFSQLTLELRGFPADSIFFSNITQDNEFQFIRYAPVMKIKLNGALNDLYNITFYTGNDKRMNQLWLNGGAVIVKGAFTGKVLEIDTVIDSGLYYKSIEFRNRFAKLVAQDLDSTTINTFLLEEVNRNLDNVFSIEIATNFFRRNTSRKNELAKLLPLLARQDASIRNHLLNPYRKIENILTRNKIELTKFKFYTSDGKLESLTLSKGKRYLIDMWFVGCAPCIEQHAEITNTLTALNTLQIDVIGISVDQNQTQWRNFLDKKKYSWRNLRETDEHEKRLRTDMLIESYPTYFLIDSEGTILYRSNSFREMKAFLKLP